jgi:hypothetical protein
MATHEQADLLIALGCLGLLEFSILLWAARSLHGGSGDTRRLALFPGRTLRRRVEFWFQATPFGLAISLALVVSGVYLH